MRVPIINENGLQIKVFFVNLFSHSHRIFCYKGSFYQENRGVGITYFPSTPEGGHEVGAGENRGLKPWRIGGGESFERAARGRNRRKITQ